MEPMAKEKMVSDAISGLICGISSLICGISSLIATYEQPRVAPARSSPQMLPRAHRGPAPSAREQHPLALCGWFAHPCLHPRHIVTAL